jgi:hypothetical protein
LASAHPINEHHFAHGPTLSRCSQPQLWAGFPGIRIRWTRKIGQWVKVDALAFW